MSDDHELKAWDAISKSYADTNTRTKARIEKLVDTKKIAIVRAEHAVVEFEGPLAARNEGLLQKELIGILDFVAARKLEHKGKFGLLIVPDGLPPFWASAAWLTGQRQIFSEEEIVDMFIRSAIFLGSAWGRYQAARMRDLEASLPLAAHHLLKLGIADGPDPVSLVSGPARKPGRPTMRDLIIAEFERRSAAGETCPGFKVNESRALLAWSQANHPDEAPTDDGTISNMIRDHLNAKQPRKPIKIRSNL